MQITNWLKHTTDSELQEAARKKITELQATENDIPGVLIVHNLADDSIVYLSERGRQYLNITLEEVRLPHFDYHQRFFNPDDVPNFAPQVLGMMQRNVDDEIVSYFQQVRANANESWNWFCSATKILLRDKDGKPLLAITVAVPIDAKHFLVPKIERLVNENNFLRKNQQVFNALTKREKEVLRLMALGHNSIEMAKQLYISEATAKTHRRNIRNKLHAVNNYDLMQFAQAFDLI